MVGTLTLSNFTGTFAVVILPSSIALFGCGGSVQSGGGDAGDAATTPTSDLTGTWDVVGAVGGDTPKTGSIILGRDRLVVSFGEGSLAFSTTTGSPVLSWTEATFVEPLGFAQAPSSVTLGILPLPLGGHVDITDPARPAVSCSGDLSATSITAGCVGTRPSTLREVPPLNDRIVGTRTSVLASSFGELGGTWTFDNTSGSHCDTTFSGNTVTMALSSKGKADGTLTIVFKDGIASGSTDHGLELTARRR